MTDPGRCNSLSRIFGKYNLSVTVEIVGTPTPQFTAIPPWYQLPSTTSRHNVVNITRSIADLSESTLHVQIGSLNQTVNGEVKIRKCTTEIVLPTVSSAPPTQHLKIPELTSVPPFKLCLYIPFVPPLNFCERNPSFNHQARKLMKQLTKDLTFNSSLNCHYIGNIYGIFVENDTKCSSLRYRIVASMELRKNLSSACKNSSRIKAYMSQWSRNKTNGKILVIEERQINRTHCNNYLEGLPSNDTRECHRIFYCYKKNSKKDRTVCLNKNHHFRAVRVRVDHKESIDVLENPRMLCEESSTITVING